MVHHIYAVYFWDNINQESFYLSHLYLLKWKSFKFHDQLKLFNFSINFFSFLFYLGFYTRRHMDNLKLKWHLGIRIIALRICINIKWNIVPAVIIIISKLVGTYYKVVLYESMRMRFVTVFPKFIYIYFNIKIFH